MTAVRDALHFLRWRLVPVRYAGKLRAGPRPRPAAAPRTRLAATIDQQGHAAGPALDAPTLAQVQAIYRPRVAAVVPSSGGHPFTNLVRPEDFAPENPVFRFAWSAPVLDVAHDYFGGRFILDSIQVLYSWPTEGEPRESQLWHKDYGDTRTLHCVAYLNDVQTLDDGPFVYVDKADTRRIGRSPVIRRIDDTRFAAELGDGRLRQFYGRAGESVFVDPSACYHYGSRCRNGRLAIFVTFFTDRPFVAPTPPIVAHRERIAAAASTVRPDLSDAYLRRLLQL
jgi:hypothetical protein